jgi:DNA-binding NtrC family response regulator
MLMNESGKYAILCVDDEAIILLSLKQELRSLFGDRFEYESALDAGSALEVIDELAAEGIELALIISDLIMPGMRGDQFLVKAGERCPGASLVLITGQADEESLELLKERIPDLGLIRKPWNAARLRSLVEGLIPPGEQSPGKP